MIRIMVGLAAVISAMAFAGPSQEPPLSDTRLPVSTLVREDIFAGFMEEDMARFARGEANIERLLEQRPDERPVLLAWKAGATMFRAVLAHESHRAGEFREKYRTALGFFAEAKKLGPKDLGVDAATGGTYVVFADRLPEEHRAAAWSEAYECYRRLWKQQAGAADKLPTHLRGELLGGLAQSAQRTGRTQETEEYVDKILKLLPDTPYEPVARQWKQDPASAARTSVTCLSCHAPGRLAPRRAALEKE